MTILQTIMTHVSFLDVMSALLVVAFVERAILRFAPGQFCEKLGYAD